MKRSAVITRIDYILPRDLKFWWIQK